MTHGENDPGAGPSVAEPDLEIPAPEATGLDSTEARDSGGRIFDERLDGGGAPNGTG